MVTGMATRTAAPHDGLIGDSLNRVFQALADPTRRAVLERLGRGPAAMSDLHRSFTMALPSFSQHLDVLENCGLVTSTKHGRVRTYQLVPTAGTGRSLARRPALVVDRRLGQLDTFLTDLEGDPP